MLVEGLGSLGLRVTSPLSDDFRSAIVSFLVEDPERIVGRLSEEGIRVSVRGGMIRVSPHFYNDERELETFLDTISELV
jgi:selenocysteine lyase/cysteine desulfurase